MGFNEVFQHGLRTNSKSSTCVRAFIDVSRRVKVVVYLLVGMVLVWCFQREKGKKRGRGLERGQMVSKLPELHVAPF